MYVNCGGDGSLTRILEQFKYYEIDIDMMQYCILPFGTSNDLANACGWG